MTFDRALEYWIRDRYSVKFKLDDKTISNVGISYVSSSVEGPEYSFGLDEIVISFHVNGKDSLGRKTMRRREISTSADIDLLMRELWDIGNKKKS